MKKNQVQFQPGMSLMGLLERYGSEAQCREALRRRAGRTGFAARTAVMRGAATSNDAMCTSATAASGRYR